MTDEAMHPDDAALVTRRAELLPMPDRHDVRYQDVLFDAVFLAIGLARENAALARAVDRRLDHLQHTVTHMTEDLAGLATKVDQNRDAAAAFEQAVGTAFTTLNQQIADLIAAGNAGDPAAVEAAKTEIDATTAGLQSAIAALAVTPPASTAPASPSARSGS